MNSIFSAYDISNGYKLWKYDGTNAPSMVAGIISGSGISSIPGYLTVFNNELYFSAYDGINGPMNCGNMMELMLQVWLLISTCWICEFSFPAHLTVFNNELYFKAFDGINGNELWKYDGTNAPSWLLISTLEVAAVTLTVLTVFNNELYFTTMELTDTNCFRQYDVKYMNPSMVADINSHQWQR